MKTLFRNFTTTVMGTIVSLILLFGSTPALSEQLKTVPKYTINEIKAHDARFCGEPARYKSGKIKRGTSAQRVFASLYPCPEKNPTTGKCVFKIDHVIPISRGGCPNKVINLQWLAPETKVRGNIFAKDVYELWIYDTGTVHARGYYKGRPAEAKKWIKRANLAREAGIGLTPSKKALTNAMKAARCTEVICPIDLK